MNSLLFVTGNHTEAAAAEQIFAESRIQASVLITDTENVLHDVERYFGNETGVTVAKGQLASLLKKQSVFPLVEVVITGQDLADLLSRAVRQCTGKPCIALIGERYMFSDPEPIARILGAEVYVYYIAGSSSFPEVFQQAKNAGVQLVVADEALCEEAEKEGFRTEKISDIRLSLLSAIRMASRLCTVMTREMQRSLEIRSLLQYSSDAIIRLGKSGEIVFLNPRAEKAIGRPREEILGKKLLEMPELSYSSALVRAMDSHQDIYSIVLQFRRSSYVANIASLSVQGIHDGWILSMQEFAAIDDMDERIRQERHRRGYVAETHFADFPSKSPKMQRVVHEAETYAQYDVPILITGEPRLSKKRLAECIHNASMRRGNPFVAVDLGTMPLEKQFDLLFGRGEGDVGMVSYAHKGTLFILDVHTLMPECQRQLLSILRYGYFFRRSSEEAIPISMRFICSTFMDLDELVREGKWLPQLANTLKGLMLSMPPIREIPEEIPYYVNYYLEQSIRKFKKQVSLSDEVMERLCHYSWPSNLRDIEYFCMKAVMLASEPVITLDFVTRYLLPDLEEGPQKEEMHIVANEEELKIRRILKECGNNRNEAAERLGMSRSTLWRKMKNYGI